MLVHSLIYEFHRALGQYFNYETALIEAQEPRELFIAIPESILNKLLGSLIVRKSIERVHMKLIVVNLENETIVEWKK